jgi:hypothetical protein
LGSRINTLPLSASERLDDEVDEETDEFIAWIDRGERDGETLAVSFSG